MKQVIIILSIIFAFSQAAFSQKQVRAEMRNGNKEYRQKKFTEAEISYRKALEGNARSADVAYNLGNSLYKQEKFPESLEQYMASASDEKDKEKAAAAWHNIGNVFMAGGDFQKSIEAYKQALRRFPQDEETRYNLALAQKLLEDQEQQDQDQNQDQNQDKQDQDQKQDKQDQQQEQQQNQNQMQQQNAEQILDAMMQNERDTQEKVKAQQQQQQRQRKTGKDW